MAGLFYKDWLSFLRNDLKGMAFAVLILTVGSSGSAGQRHFEQISMALPMLFLWIGLDTMISDKKSGWDAYARSLPLTAKRIVLEKYLFVFGMFSAGTALAFLLSAALGAAGLKNALQICIFAGIPLLVTAVLFPLLYRANAQTVITAVMLFCLAAVMFAEVFFLKNPSLPEALASGAVFSVLKYFPIPAGLVLCAGSYAVSVRVYGNGANTGHKA